MKKHDWLKLIKILATPVIELLEITAMIIGAFLITWPAYYLFKFVLYLHQRAWVLALVISILMIYLLFKLLFFLKEVPTSTHRFKLFFGSPSGKQSWSEKNPMKSILVISVACIFSILMGLAGISLVLHHHTTLVSYAIAPCSAVQTGNENIDSSLLDFYLWHFVDGIPGLDLPEFTDWCCPLTYKGGVGGFIVAVSRYGVYLLAGAIFAAWSAINKKKARGKKLAV